MSGRQKQKRWDYHQVSRIFGSLSALVFAEVTDRAELRLRSFFEFLNKCFQCKYRFFEKILGY